MNGRPLERAAAELRDHRRALAVLAGSDALAPIDGRELVRVRDAHDRCLLEVARMLEVAVPVERTGDALLTDAGRAALVDRLLAAGLVLGSR